LESSGTFSQEKSRPYPLVSEIKGFSFTLNDFEFQLNFI
jgi:hypothetical protein